MQSECRREEVGGGGMGAIEIVDALRNSFIYIVACYGIGGSYGRVFLTVGERDRERGLSFIAGILGKVIKKIRMNVPWEKGDFFFVVVVVCGCWS